MRDVGGKNIVDVLWIGFGNPTGFPVGAGGAEVFFCCCGPTRPGVSLCDKTNRIAEGIQYPQIPTDGFELTACKFVEL